jgi:ribosomal protein S18 acetylase RimI-like enzyme
MPDSMPERNESHEGLRGPWGVRRAKARDVAVVRAARLRALADVPDAFEFDAGAEESWSEVEWRRWISGRAVFVAAGVAGAVGLVVGEPDADARPTAWLMSLWVSPGWRGRGVGDALVAAIVEWARSAGVREVRLHVGEGNAPARRLYERNGFSDTGAREPRPRDGVMEIEMARRL